MQKSPLQYSKIIFQSKVIPLFLPKCSNFYHSEMYTIYAVPKEANLYWGGGGLNYGLESGSNKRARAACIVSEH